MTVGEEEQTYEADHVILTAGGLAGRVRKGRWNRDADGREVRTYDCSLRSGAGATDVRRSVYPKISGVRAGAKIELVCGGEVRALDQGEIQFTDYGIPGFRFFRLVVLRQKRCQKVP